MLGPGETQIDPIAAFTAAYSAAPQGIVQAPGRISLIGEHTDYNEGFVFPCALDLYTTAVFRAREDSRVRVRSTAYPDYEDHFDISQGVTLGERDWANYVRGVFFVAQDYGFQFQKGIDLLITSQLDQKAGLASSAALATSVTGAIAKGLNLPIDKRSLALIAQKAENDFMGKMCGIMDQLTATMGEQDHALLIDCEDFSIKKIRFPEELRIVVIDSRARKNFVGHEWSELRNACFEAAAALNVKALRQANMAMLESNQSEMSEGAFRRARFIIGENERIPKVAEALQYAQFNTVCRLMNESHESMKNDFGNTIPEIDFLVDLCRKSLGVNGAARMTGGGFGGSVTAICKKEHVTQLITFVAEAYYQQFAINAPVHVCQPAAGIRYKWLNK